MGYFEGPTKKPARASLSGCWNGYLQIARKSGKKSYVVMRAVIGQLSGAANLATSKMFLMPGMRTGEWAPPSEPAVLILWLPHQKFEVSLA